MPVDGQTQQLPDRYTLVMAMHASPGGQLPGESVRYNQVNRGDNPKYRLEPASRPYCGAGVPAGRFPQRRGAEFDLRFPAIFRNPLSGNCPPLRAYVDS